MKDQLFNATTVAQLGREFAQGVPGFDPERFAAEALAGFEGRELMARMDWLADCIEAQLAQDFPTMADQLTASLAAPLDPQLSDDDFGHFIHAVPGILAVRHGLEDHHPRALDLLYEATQRFSMEFYIRPFLNRWPAQTLERLAEWARDDNYHVRRLVSEGTRPRLPWAKAVTLTQDQTLPLLNALHADPTRYVTRSVSNHLNDIAKFAPSAVLDLLSQWQAQGAQEVKELAWMTRHSLRTLIKDGHPQALEMLGYRGDAPVEVALNITTPHLRMGEALQFEVQLQATEDCPVLVDYRLRFVRAGGKSAEKVFKLKQGKVKANTPLVMSKTHKLKAGASTFTLYPGTHGIVVQVNGRDCAQAEFELTA